MGISAAYVAPHPPLIIPACGRGQEKGIQATIDAFEQISLEISKANPQTIVIVSPHAPYMRDCFFIDSSPQFAADFESFRAPSEKVSAQCDLELAEEIISRASSLPSPVPLTTRRSWGERLDHATFITLWFIANAYRSLGISDPNFKIVRIGLSMLPSEYNRDLGKAIADAISALDRNAIIFASGDLSHKLKADGPYGISQEGLEFEERIDAILREADFDALFEFTEEFRDAAAECGLGAFQIMAGALEQATTGSEDTQSLAVIPTLLAHEGPFGVGYAVASYTPIDMCVELARLTVESYVCNGTPAPKPEGLPEWMLQTEAATFVSLHIGDDLRGCIGTLQPTKPTVADEIIGNAILACSQDPRFSPVRPAELDYISYNVDVLETPEPIDSPDQLDVKTYGVIVSKGMRRGVLLPDLEGVDTVDYQIAIAKRKAGIAPTETDVKLERFKVVRHTIGGNAREEL